MFHRKGFSWHELAPTGFIVRVSHGLQSSHAGHEKMSHTHTRDMNQNLRNMHWPLHVFIVRVIFHGFQSSHAGQEKWSFMTRDRRTQAKKNIPQPYPRRGGNRAPDPKKTIEKSVFLHPGCARGDSSPGQNKTAKI